MWLVMLQMNEEFPEILRDKTMDDKYTLLLMQIRINIGKGLPKVSKVFNIEY